ncbi:hypothetical protein KKB10_04150 [Patescibacteria group bacterium]|nr:hypothetical protein [Patescibacteria group bacterium]MBU1074999.1 hypothetical protein [Patescibacteria group bacterium]MBU1952492.1 hypothetical protein [Patescibacteria group bacterium]
MLLLIALIVTNGVVAFASPAIVRPNGTLFERAGETIYTVHEHDDVGLWQVSFGSPKHWLELIALNPQFEDSDLILPGQELKIPPSLVRIFRMIATVDAAGGPQPAKGAGPPDTVRVHVPVEADHGFPWSWAIAVFLLCLIVFALWHRHDRDSADLRSLTKTVNGQAHDLEAQENRELCRRNADPYSGPPAVPGGLLTAKSAAQHFVERYQRNRRNLTVGESEGLPDRVVIERIVPVDVRGLMGIKFHGYNAPVAKHLEEWTPAWQAFLSDGSSRITLMMCGNDVYAGGGGYEVLPDTQIRPRQDIPPYEPETPVPIWPVPGETDVAEEPDEVPSGPEEVQNFLSVKVTSSDRYVLKPEVGTDVIVELGVLADDVTLGIEGDEVYRIIAGQRRVIGRIVGHERS